MITKVIPMDKAALEPALQLLSDGQAIAFPTDTVYGLGADALNPAAIERLYVAKDRPPSKAIPLLLADETQANDVAVDWDERAQRLAREFWPGALTLIVRARDIVPKVVRADGETVALRVPNQDWLRTLIRRFGRPLATTSANLSGAPDPFSAQEVLPQLNGRIPLIVDGGRTQATRASTIVVVTGAELTILRQGEITRPMLENALQKP
jgi:L-threonylcarbamoyladenylate synthase